MGSQNIKGCESSEQYHDHVQILTWRANAQYNSHIARTFLFSKGQTRSMAYQTVINTQLSNRPFIDLNQLNQNPTLSQSSAQQRQILAFEDYVGSLKLVEGWLEMEENLYVLITLLFGYEQIYRKLGWACVEENCCHLTPKGEVRAWINSNPTSCMPDLQIVKEDEHNRLIGDGKGRKIYCKTEASICKSIIAMAHRLSDKREPFILFYEEISNFVKSNLLQNMNFNSIRTFINGFAFRNRLTIKSDISIAIRKVHKQSDRQSQIQRSSSSVLKFKKGHTRSHLSQQFTLKSGSIEPSRQENQSSSNIEQRVSVLNFERSQISYLQPEGSKTTLKQSLRNINKSIQTSQIMNYQSDSPCESTQKLNPRKSNYISSNKQLVCSEIMETSKERKENKTKKSRLYYFEKENQAKLSKRMNVDDDEQSDQQSIVIKPPNNQRKLVRFHSHNPSFDQNQFNHVPLHITIPEKSEEHYTHHSLTHTKTNLKTKHETKSIFAQSPLNRSEFSHSQASNRDGQSRALTRVVSGLVSNEQIDLCESVGSFQSFENGSSSGYSGILLGMGRSVVMGNDSSKRGSNNNWGGNSHHIGAHMTR